MWGRGRLREDGEGVRALGDTARAPEQASARRRYFKRPRKNRRGPHLVPRADFIALPLALTPPALSRPNPRPNPRAHPHPPPRPRSNHPRSRRQCAPCKPSGSSSLRRPSGTQAALAHRTTGMGARRGATSEYDTGLGGPRAWRPQLGAGAALVRRGGAGTMIHGERSIHAVACRVGGC